MAKLSYAESLKKLGFAFTQPMLYADPHFLGAVADAIGADDISRMIAKIANESADECRISR